MIVWVSQAAWLSTRILSFAISSTGGLTTSSISHLKINLRSSLDLPTEVDPDHIYRKEEVVQIIVYTKNYPPSIAICCIYYRGLIHRVRMLAVQKYECQPVWIPVIRLSVRQRVTHPLAYGLLSRNSSTHTLTPTSRTVTLGMNHRVVEADLGLFRSSV